MKLNDAFPSNYVKAEDVEGQEISVTIAKLTIESMKSKSGNEEQKPVLHFSDYPKQMVLNATNWKRIAQILGNDDSDFWTGKKITLVTEIVDSFGEMKPAVRVKMVSGKQAEIDAYWVAVNERFLTPDEGRKVLKENNGDFKKALEALQGDFAQA